MPTALDGGWRTVLCRSSPDVAYALYAATTAGRPSASVYAQGTSTARGPDTLRPAVDAPRLDLRRHERSASTSNGHQVATRPRPARSATSRDAPAGSAATTIWPEYFDGRIDEVRVYNRALTRRRSRPTWTAAQPDTDGADRDRRRRPAAARRTSRRARRCATAFSEAMIPATPSPLDLPRSERPGGAPVPATVTYDAIDGKATLTPATALQYGATYTRR